MDRKHSDFLKNISFRTIVVNRFVIWFALMFICKTEGLGRWIDILLDMIHWDLCNVDLLINVKVRTRCAFKSSEAHLESAVNCGVVTGVCLRTVPTYAGISKPGIPCVFMFAMSGGACNRIKKITCSCGCLCSLTSTCFLKVFSLCCHWGQALMTDYFCLYVNLELYKMHCIDSLFLRLFRLKVLQYFGLRYMHHDLWFKSHKDWSSRPYEMRPARTP